MKFKSKIDWWVHLVVWLVIFMSVWPLAFYLRDSVTAALVVSCTMLVADVLLVLPIYFVTFYTFSNTALHIRCGLIAIKVKYKDIKSIYETRDPSASLGLSLDRISINYSKGEVLISPKNKQEFMRLLKQRME